MGLLQDEVSDILGEPVSLYTRDGIWFYKINGTDFNVYGPFMSPEETIAFAEAQNEKR